MTTYSHTYTRTVLGPSEGGAGGCGRVHTVNSDCDVFEGECGVCTFAVNALASQHSNTTTSAETTHTFLSSNQATMRGIHVCLLLLLYVLPLASSCDVTLNDSLPLAPNLATTLSSYVGE